MKYLLEKNEAIDLSGLDALMAIKNLEKQIYEKYVPNPLEYDSLCQKICKAFKYLIAMENLSKHIRNKGFGLPTMIKLINKDRSEMKKLDLMAKNKLDKFKKNFMDTINVSESMKLLGDDAYHVTKKLFDESENEEDHLMNSGSKENLLTKGKKMANKQKPRAILPSGSKDSEGNFSNSEEEEKCSELSQPDANVQEEEIAHNPKKYVKTHALAYDPETKQYEINEDKFIQVIF